MILSHALRAVSKVSATNVSYITNATRKGNGTFNVSVNSGDTILGFVLERTGDTVSLSGFSNDFSIKLEFYIKSIFMFLLILPMTANASSNDSIA